MNAQVDLTNCASEPIRIPGAILPHGAMLVVDCETFEVQQVAGDTLSLLGQSNQALLGSAADSLFTPEQVKLLHNLASESKPLRPRHLLDPALRIVPDRPLDASVHRVGDALVMEFEAADTTERYAANPFGAVQELLDGLDSAGSLHDFCQIAAQRVRNVTGYDRVMVYRFMADGSGWIFAESHAAHQAPFLDLHYPAEDIPAQARALYLENWLRLIAEVDYEPAPLVPSVHPRTGLPLDMSQATLRNVSPIHREYLRNMGVGASMSISIIIDGRLWGLIACHHDKPRRLPRHLRAVCEIFGRVFSSKLETRERAEQAEMRLAHRGMRQEILRGLVAEADYAEGVARRSPSLIDYISAGGAAIRAAQRGGLALYVNSAIKAIGTTPSVEEITALAEWLIPRSDQHAGVFATDRLGEVFPPARAYTAIGSGLLAISISREPRDLVMWFRPEVVETVSWGGDPTKPVELGPNGDRLTPRKSFEVWKQVVRGHASPWTEAEVEAAFDLRVALLDIVVQRLDAAAHERDALREHEHLLMSELDHRMKNVLANILAIARQTARNAGSVKEYVDRLEARISAMGKAHSLLTKSRWESVSFRDLIQEELEQYSSGGTAITLDGPFIRLTPKAALALSLTIHELSTNAAKYGALSVEGGKVAVTWRQSPDAGVELHWQESGGPEVRKPTKRGFGSTLIERAFSMETGGKAALDFAPGGVVCHIVLPASSLITGAQSPA